MNLSFSFRRRLSALTDRPGMAGTGIEEQIRELPTISRICAAATTRAAAPLGFSAFLVSLGHKGSQGEPI